jgi:two-component system LytT family sensor kinase
VPDEVPRRQALAPIFLIGAVVAAVAAATGAQLTRHLPPDLQLSIVLQNLAYWGLWTLLTPMVLRLGMRWQFAPGRRLHALAVHVLLGVAVAVLHIALITLAAAAIRTATTDASWAQSWAGMRAPTRMHIEWEITVYWALIGLAHAIAYKREADQRALAAAQLETRLLRAQTRALQHQLQPHFMFNTLQTITALVRRDADAAEHMLERLSHLLRLSLRAGDAMEVALHRELEHTRAYMEIVQANMGDRLRVVIDIPESLHAAAVPALLLQPLVENAVRHGIAGRAAGGTVVIDGRVVDEALELRVIDDGIGFDGDAAGIGLQNTTQRLAQLYGTNQRLTIRNRPSGGTEVLIRLPYRAVPLDIAETACA